MTRRTRKSQGPCDSGGAVTPSSRKHKRTRRRLSNLTQRTISEDKTEITETSVRERMRKKPQQMPHMNKLTRDLMKLKSMISHRPKRTYLRDEGTEGGHLTTAKNEPGTTSISKEVDENSISVEVKTQAPADSGKSTTTTTSSKSKSNENKSLWADICCQGGLKPLLKEFATIRKYLPKNVETEVFCKHQSKNRYSDVLCLDETRVILKDRTKDNDYIHANWVELPSQRKYICTQGPMEESVDDFWFMVFKEKVSAIIMLCDISEGGEPKCMEYFPTSVVKELTFGDAKIKYLSRDKPIDTIACSTMSVEMSPDKDPHKLHHYKWVDWPDRAAPLSASPVISLLQKTRPLFGAGPVVVHCSAGIGRTGTYCAVDFALDRLAGGGLLKICDVVKEIRKQRLHSVQTTLQYIYLHECVLEYLIATNAIPKTPNVRRFRREYDAYIKRFNDRMNARAANKAHKE